MFLLQRFCLIKGITLKDGDSVCSAIPIHDKSDKFGVFLNNGLGKQIDLKELPLQKKAGKGLMVSKLAEELENHIERMMGFRVLDHELKFYGQCKDCVKKSAEKVT